MEAFHRSDTDASSHRPVVSFDLRFCLAESEWRAAVRLLHPIAGHPYGKPVLRVLNGCGAIFIAIVPHRYGWSWPLLFRFQPVQAAFLAAVALVCIWSATGVGMNRWNHRLNRLDLERHIVVSDQGVTVNWNARAWNYQWKDFGYFRETEGIIVLRTAGTKFWTIPLRILQPEDAVRLRELLAQKLPRRQPWSWSPDSSGQTSH